MTLTLKFLEMHHRQKVDAPSGTALALGQAVAKGRDVDLGRVSQRARDGITGERRRGDIGFAVLRGGDVVGNHSVILAGENDRLELTHQATSRQIFCCWRSASGYLVTASAPGSVRHAGYVRFRRIGLPKSGDFSSAADVIQIH